MMRRARTRGAASILLCVLLVGMLAGCWDYRSLDELALVAGIAIDLEPTSGLFLLTFEIIDLITLVQAQGLTSFSLSASGKTIFDAVRNAKMKYEHKLYFGDALLVILSRAIAEKIGVFPVVDWILRDNETRETVHLVISQKETAAEIFQAKIREGSVVSYEIVDIVEEDSETTASTRAREIYEIFNTLRTEGLSLVAPALSTVEDDGKEIPVLNGMYTFTGDVLTGYLSPEDTKYYLFATDKVKGGILTIESPFDGGKPVISLEIADNKTKHSFEETEEGLTVRIETETKVYLAEVEEPMDLLDQKVYEAIKTKAQERLKQEMQRVMEIIQKELRNDILGLGNMLHKRKHKMWHRYQDRWSEVFPEVQLKVSCEVEIINSAHIKTTIKEK